MWRHAATNVDDEPNDATSASGSALNEMYMGRVNALTASALAVIQASWDPFAMLAHVTDPPPEVVQFRNGILPWPAVQVS